LRRLQKFLQTPGDFGFCFRLDFDLRPGGKMGPLITSPSQFQDYYWNQGETWERLAMVRLRCLLGSPEFAVQVNELAKKFSFRRFLDFTLLEDLKALRAQVHSSGFQRRDGEIHLKLEVGGIRDIELFVHSLLVLNGGKIPELQTRSTSLALDLLAERKLLPEKEAKFLKETYWLLRHEENLAQAVDDRQTHSIPWRYDLDQLMRQVDEVVSGLLGREDQAEVSIPTGEKEQRKWLRKLGFSADAVDNAWGPLIRATALSYKNDRDERARQRFLARFVLELAKYRHPDPDFGLRLLLDFVRATRGKATFFSTLLRSPRLIEDLARLFCLSPYLGSILTARPELLDHFILRVDEEWAEDLERLLEQMAERKLLTEIWAANQFLADRRLTSLFARVTDTADEIAQQLLKRIKQDYPQAHLELVALGKWGGRELGLRSDLDLIFVTTESPNESDMKVARRFLSRLVDPMKSGTLYEVDMRLRPSGHSGPLLVTLERLHEYWQYEAQIWERQAHPRSRPLSPLVTLDKSLLVNKPLVENEREELRSIRKRLLKPLGAREIDLKYVPGGLIDIEFSAQIAILAKHIRSSSTSTFDMIDELAAADGVWTEPAERVKQIYAEIREFEQMLQLSSTHKLSQVSVSHPAFVKAASLLDVDPETAWKRLTRLVKEAREILNPLDESGYEA
jgi:glutamate-ammonia-ligase adenylyltransferase